MKRRNLKAFDYCLLIIGTLLIVYYLFNLSSGPFSFIFIFFIIGLTMLTYSAIELYSRVNIFSVLPEYIKRTFYILTAIAFFIFASIESAIIYYGEQSTFEESDVLIVLGAGLMQDRISTTLRYRLENALQYHEQYPDVPIIVSGGQGRDETRSEAVVMKEYLIEHGVKEEIIYIEDASFNTYENFTFSAKLIEKEKITAEKVTVITNKFHIMRARYLGERCGFDVLPLPAENYTPQNLNNYMREVFAMIKSFILYS